MARAHSNAREILGSYGDYTVYRGRFDLADASPAYVYGSKGTDFHMKPFGSEAEALAWAKSKSPCARHQCDDGATLVLETPSIGWAWYCNTHASEMLRASPFAEIVDA